MDNSLQQITIGSLSEYQDIVFDTFNCWKAGSNDGKTPFIWFRGQSKDKPLLPSVLRESVNQNTGNVCRYNEFKILVSFSSLYRNYTSERFQEKSSEFYSFMQHYGIPTRLLDWTENAAFALYFAVSHGAHDADTQRVVWLMNPGAINQLTTNSISCAPLLSDGNLVQARMKMVGYIKNEKLTKHFWEDEPNFKKLSEEYLKFPLAFYPSSSGNIRIATQKGGFTIHGTERRPIESFFDNPEIRKYLIKLKISKESVASIREQLQIIGVTPRSVYPDIFGFATELSGPDYMLSQALVNTINTSETWDGFEKDALLVKNITKKQASEVVRLLQDSTGLLANAFPIAVSPNNEDSTLAKMSLLSHNFNTLKCSVDLALRGYYVQSQNILRVVYENWVAFHYISQVPEEAKLWLEHNPSKKVPKHSKMLTKLGSDFSPVIKRMEKWYSTLCSFAHTDPINLVSHISQDKHPNETSIHFGTTFDHKLFKISAYTLVMWIGIMLSTIKKFVPEKNQWHEQEVEFQKKLQRYIDEQNKA